MAGLLAEAIKKAKRVYICGNGGSFANAQHIQNDLEGKGIRAHTLNPASLTRTANDQSYEEIFAQWVGVHGEQGDLLLVLSGSGNSPNIIKALRKGKELGMTTWALLGYPAGKAASIADVSIVAGPNMQQAEEAQLVAGHEVWGWLKNS